MRAARCFNDGVRERCFNWLNDVLRRKRHAFVRLAFVSICLSLAIGTVNESRGGTRGGTCRDLQ